MKKAGFIQNGKLQKSVVIEKLSKHGDRAVIERAYDACANQVGPNECQTTRKQYSCFKKNIKMQ